MEKIGFIEPRHAYAPPKGDGYVYSPTSMWTAASRVIMAGGDVGKIQDANLHPLEDPDAEHVGVGVIGAMYVPEVREKIIKVFPGVRPVIGGRSVTGFVGRSEPLLTIGGPSVGGRKDISQFHRLFGERAVYGNDDEALALALGLDARAFPRPEHTSLVPVYERISDGDMQAYLSHEISFYLSQGCKYACTFCAADKTFKDPVTGLVTKAEERYRDGDVLRRDMDYLIKRAEGFGLKRLDMYLSNLDLFQTPERLGAFARIILELRKERRDFGMGMRALATAKEFIATHESSPQVIHDMMNAGLHTVGFGVDGATPQQWQAIRKGHNSSHTCLEAVRIAREVYGLTPQALTVFGFDSERETPDYLEASYDYLKLMVEKYGAVPRTHVAKEFLPGGEGWKQPANQQKIEFLMQHPEYMQALDITALPSSITHPSVEFRQRVWDWCWKFNELEGNATRVTYPIDPECDDAENERRRQENLGRYDI
jgi:hypothetical protein